ncbi:MAG TPA: LLM class flavin-dependent oxidoreductase [Anaerolineaceae bacterium]|jgi:probable F420-dependent oxidoreductase|nr:LLM class flavin-dependent oxidoreductase [Anaerolineaceae bacterium]
MKIGVVLMLMELPGLDRALSWDEIRQSALRNEDLGFDSLWIYDHLLYRSARGRTTGIWEGWSMLSALAAVTRRVELGPLVACNSFRNPALLAKMAHTVDEISGGRLILGLGAGWNQPEYDAFGLPFDHRVDRFEEALQILRPLLKTGQVDFAGRYYTARDCEITPRSPRPAGPPLLIGAGKPRMLRLTAQYADYWNVCYMTIPRSIQKEHKLLLNACCAVGRDPATLPATYTVSLAYPDLMGWSAPKKRGYLTGSIEEIAAVLQEYERLGAAHLMFHLTPSTPQAYERLAQAVALYRAQVSAA